MRTRFAQLSLPTKILLALTLLFAVTRAIVWDNVGLSISSSLKEPEEIRRSFPPSSLPSRCPEVVRTAAENYSTPIGDPHEVARMPNSGSFVQNDAPCELNQNTLTPFTLDSPHAPNPGKALLAGHKVGAMAFRELNEATGSDFVFGAKDWVISSSLNPRVSKATPGNLLSAKDSKMVSDAGQNSAWFRQAQDISGSKVEEISILRSFDDAEQLIAVHSTTILLLWLAATSGALALTYRLAQRIVERMDVPAHIVANALSRNYAFEAGGCDEHEIGRLGRMLNVMCGSIRMAGERAMRQERITGTGQLSASILHDLRNPVAAISGAAEMLVDADLSPAHVKRLAGNIYRASRRIQELLQEHISLSRDEARVLEPSRLREVAEAACESLSATAESHGTTLAVDIAPVIELPLKRTRMERALVNLIANAIEAMPEGGQVRLSAQFVADSVVVHVDDTGPGVAPEIRSRLFQPFVTAGKSNGVGLGLVFSRQTVLEHGGDLWLDIAPGGGARFSLRLPGAHLVQAQAVAV
jgi:signal transduction histidine kinase